MKITVKRSTMVKPAEETPRGSTVWLSSIDLVFPATHHTRSVFFYRYDGTSNFFDAAVLEVALSRALVDFYPFAGRLRKDDNGRIEINCTDEGVVLMEAECDGALDDLGAGFSPGADISLVPIVDYSNGISSFPLALLQLTRFKCGGVCLGFAGEHHVSDGISGLHFFNTWSEIARGLTPAVPPSLDRRLLSPRNPPRPQFPHIEHHPPPSLKAPLCNPDDTSFPTFRLSRNQINALKQKCRDDDDDDSRYTTYEVVAGHAWRCVTIARGLPKDQETKLHLHVDARGRLEPPLPAGFFGNGVFYTAALALCGDLESKPLRYAVGKVKEANARMNNEYLRSSLDYVELNLRDNVEGIVRSKSHAKCPNFQVISWIRLPMYEADFGWGKPIHSGPAGAPPEGKAYLLPDHQNEGGLLLALTLHKRHMKRFEKILFHELPVAMSTI